MKIEIDGTTVHDLRLLAGAWGDMTLADTIRRLVEDLRKQPESSAMSTSGTAVQGADRRTTSSYNPDVTVFPPQPDDE